jgi:hypothetical protein
MAAVSYPGISFLRGYEPKDALEQFAKGFGFGEGVRNEAQAKDALSAYIDSLTGGGQSQARPAASDALVRGSADAAEAAADPMLTAYFANTRRSESGGNDAARNPNSTATGRYQFLEGTWNDLASRHPQLGLTPDGRTDPAQQERAMKVFTAENARTLKGSGLPVNPGTLYAAHFLGPGGASKVLAADPNASVASMLDPSVVQANPQLGQMTVAQFQQWANEKGGNGSGGYAPPMAGGIAAQRPSGDVLKALMLNPVTREFGMQLAQGKGSGQQWQQFTGKDGKMYQVDTLTGKVDAIGGSGVNVSLNTGEGADAALNKKLSEKEGEAWAGYKEAATVSASNAQDFAVLDELIQIAPQGPITGRLAETFKGFSSAGDAFQSIVKRIAPTLRAPGSGATSDIEYDGMLRSLPALSNTPEANAMIASIMKAKADINMKRGELITAYQAGEISIGEARRQMNELNRVSILTPEMRQALDGLGAQPSQSSGDAPPNVDPELWAVMTAEEKALWN